MALLGLFAPMGLAALAPSRLAFDADSHGAIRFSYFDRLPFSVPPKNGDRTSPGPHEHRLDGPRRGARAQRGAASVHAGTLVRSRNHLTSGRGARRQSIRYIRPPVVTKVRSESDAEPRVSGRLVGYMIQCQYASMSVPVCSDSHATSCARVM